MATLKNGADSVKSIPIKYGRDNNRENYVENMKKLPNCPNCDTKLLDVVSHGKSRWTYDQGHYHNLDNKDVTLSCPKCGVCLDEVFQKDIYNWGLTKKDEENMMKLLKILSEKHPNELLS